MFKFAVASLALTLPAVFAESSSDRDGFLSVVSKTLEKNSGNLRRELTSVERKNQDSDFDVCDLVKLHLGDDFIDGASDGNCDCQGNLTSTLSLKCDFDNVCDEMNVFCADIKVNVTLTGIMDEAGGFGKDPTMDLKACIDTNVDFLETMCLGMDFGKPNFFLPDTCSFSYGSEECICKIDESALCYDFDCSSVVPAHLVDAISSSTCKKVDMTEGANLAMFLPALKDLPEDAGVVVAVKQEPGLTAMDAGFIAAAVEIGAHRNAAP